MTVQSGQDIWDITVGVSRDRTACTGQSGQVSLDRTERTGWPGGDSKDRTVGTVSWGKERSSGTAGTGPVGQDIRVRTAEIGNQYRITWIGKRGQDGQNIIARLYSWGGGNGTSGAGTAGSGVLDRTTRT
jgi:hypothetical protein